MEPVKASILRGRQTINGVLISWAWANGEDGPRIDGSVSAGGTNEPLPFVLTPQGRLYAQWIPQAERVLALELELKDENGEWYLAARTLEGMPENMTVPILQWSAKRPPPDRHGILKLPSPWKGDWTWVGPYGLDVRLVAATYPLPIANLRGESPSWATNLPLPFGWLECSLNLEISATDSVACVASLPVLLGRAREVVLSRWNPDPPAPAPSPVASYDPDTRIGNEAPFGQLAYLALPMSGTLKAPLNPNDAWLLPVDRSTPLYRALIKAQGEAAAFAGMQACATAYQTGAAPYAGQYVAELSRLPAPWSVLADAAAQTFGERTFADADALDLALTELFGTAPAVLAAGAALGRLLQRCMDSYVCQLVLDETAAPATSALLGALRLLALLERAAKASTQPLPADAIVGLQRARVQLPTPVFPLPQGDGMVPPPGIILGLGRLYEYSTHLDGYALGSLAAAVNLLPGETLDLSRRAESSGARSTSAQTKHSESIGSSALNEDARTVEPIRGERTTFSDLAQTYGSDGLSVTVTGNYMVQPGTSDGTNFTPVDLARRRVQQLFAKGERRSRSVEGARHRESSAYREVARLRRHLSNTSDAPQRAFYHRLVERYTALLRALGPRLLFEWSLSAPGPAMLARLNSILGQDWSIPVPPWASSGSASGVSSAADITAANYIGLLQRYNLDAVPAPPQEVITVSAMCGASTSGYGQGILQVPAGRVCTAVQVAAAPGTKGYLLVAGNAVDISTAAKTPITAIQGDLTFSLAGASEGSIVSLLFECSDVSYPSHLARWQAGIYDLLDAGYHEAMNALCAAISSCAALDAEAVLSEMLYAAVLEAVQTHYESTDGLAEQIATQLLPWLRQALPMGQAILATSSEVAPDDWLALPNLEGPLAWRQLLLAAALRVTLPLSPEGAERFLYLWRSGGRLWLAPENDTPVFSQDAPMQQLWRLLRHEDTGADQRWDFRVETSYRYLSDHLPLGES